MQLVPAVLGVIDPGSDKRDGVADRRLRQVPSVARHELDDEVAVLAFAVAGTEQAAEPRCELHVDVQVAILLMANGCDASPGAPTRIQDLKPFGVVDASKDARGGRTTSPSTCAPTLR